MLHVALHLPPALMVMAAGHVRMVGVAVLSVRTKWQRLAKVCPRKSSSVLVSMSMLEYLGINLSV